MSLKGLEFRLYIFVILLMSLK